MDGAVDVRSSKLHLARRSSGKVSKSPAINLCIDAQAIIAALSVHREGGGNTSLTGDSGLAAFKQIRSLINIIIHLNSILLCKTYRWRRKALLATPPLTTRCRIGIPCLRQSRNAIANFCSSWVTAVIWNARARVNLVAWFKASVPPDFWTTMLILENNPVYENDIWFGSDMDDVGMSGISVSPASRVQYASKAAPYSFAVGGIPRDLATRSKAQPMLSSTDVARILKLVVEVARSRRV